MKKHKVPVPQKSQDRRNVLQRILDTPNLEHVVPRLQPDVLHRVIQRCGLEDCGELVMLATPEQLTRIFDLDLWHSAQPGMDEQFDPARFGVWLEVLAEFGASPAAQKLSELDADLVVTGLAQHVRVFDGAVVTPYKTTDGLESVGAREPDHGLAFDVGGYRLIAKSTDSWEAIVEILISLDAEHPDYFHQVMRGCRALSDAGRELDELDDLLDVKQQTMFDLAIDREHRRDKQGYVTPAQARAFLEMSRELRLDSGTLPPANSIAKAYLRPPDQAATTHTAAASESFPESKLVDVLLEAGIIAQPPRALLNAPQEQTTALQRIHAHMQFVFEHNHIAYAQRNAELTFVANTIMAGCAVQNRPFTAPEAWDAAVAVCNLGLENWPPLWSGTKSLPDDFLVNHDLVTAFQVGWTMLHNDVSLYAAKRLMEVLAGLQCDDLHLQTGIRQLHIELSECSRAGVPWRARDALEVIALLDMPAWTALLGLIDEFPILHAALSASRNPRTRSVSASAFEFISENRQLTFIREFFQSLPETLRP